MIRKRILRIFLLTSCVFFLTNCRSPGKYPITFIGLDESGKEVHQLASGKYGKRFGKIVNEVSEESLEVLDEHKSENPWELNRIDVGIGITASLGFTVVSVEATPSFRLTFKKK